MSWFLHFISSALLDCCGCTLIYASYKNLHLKDEHRNFFISKIFQLFLSLFFIAKCKFFYAACEGFRRNICIKKIINIYTVFVCKKRRICERREIECWKCEISRGINWCRQKYKSATLFCNIVLKWKWSLKLTKTHV